MFSKTYNEKYTFSKQAYQYNVLYLTTSKCGIEDSLYTRRIYFVINISAYIASGK